MEHHIPNANPRIDARAASGPQQQGLLSPRHKFFRFVAATRHNSYKYDFRWSLPSATTGRATNRPRRSPAPAAVACPAPNPRVDARSPFGAQRPGICFHHRVHLYFGFVAAMRHNSYKSIAESEFTQLQSDCQIGVHSATPAPGNNPPAPQSRTRRRRGEARCRRHLTPPPRRPTIELAVLDGELAVPCTRNPPQRGRIPPQGLAQRPLLVQSSVEGWDPRDGRP